MPDSRPPYHVFEDRRYRLFGRDRDLDFLVARSGSRGFTVVTGRPRSGKTWLFDELGRRLDEVGCLVGYFESPGGPTDMPLRAVADAYARWLSSASFREQGESLLERHRGSLVSKIGQAVEGLLGTALSGTTGLPLRAEIVGLFEGLAAANQDLRTGGLNLPPLPYEKARDLVVLLGHLTGKSVVLILDQWEKSADWQRESELIDTYLRHPEDWPVGHIFAGVRIEHDNQEMLAQIGRACRQWGAAEEYPLQRMALETSEGQRAGKFLREALPEATRRIDDGDLLALTDGYAGVFDQWTRQAGGPRPKTRQELQQSAADAQATRYPDLEAQLGELAARPDKQYLEIAIRLALLPAWDRAEAWSAIERYVLDNEGDRSWIIDLQDERLLDPEAPELPSYGHETRREVALAWAKSNARARTRALATQVIESASAKITAADARFLPDVLVVLGTFERARDLALGAHLEALAICCASLLERPPSDEAAETLGGAISRLAANPSWVPLLAMALLNILNHAKQEDQLERRDQLLEDLRALAREHPQDEAVRTRLAMALFNTLNDVRQEEQLKRRDQLLEDLRSLAREHPQDDAVREHLAMALFNTLIDSKQEDQLERRISSSKTYAPSHGSIPETTSCENDSPWRSSTRSTTPSKRARSNDGFSCSKTYALSHGSIHRTTPCGSNSPVRSSIVSNSRTRGRPLAATEQLTSCVCWYSSGRTTSP